MDILVFILSNLYVPGINKSLLTYDSVDLYLFGDTLNDFGFTGNP